MKTISTALCLLCALAALAFVPSPTPSGQVVIAWQYPTNELRDDLTFNLYSATNLATPLTNWLLLTNVIGTNLSVSLTVQPGQRFFFITASNFWGESGPSNVVATPPLPQNEIPTTIRRGP